MEQPDVEMTFSPKTYDIDALGIVSNITYVRWLEDMRTEFLHENLPWDRLQDEGIGPVLAETNIKYHKAVTMGKEVTGKLWVTEVGRTSWRLKFDFVMDGETVIEAKQSGMFVDLETKKPRRLPEDLRENMRST